MEERLNKIVSLKEAIKLCLEKIKENSSKKSDSETNKKDENET